MNRVDPLSIFFGQPDEPHGTDLEPFRFDALEYPPGEPPFDGIGFDNGECSLHGAGIIYRGFGDLATGRLGDWSPPTAGSP